MSDTLEKQEAQARLREKAAAQKLQESQTSAVSEPSYLVMDGSDFADVPEATVKKKKQKKPKKKGVFYYAMPWNLVKELRDFGYELSTQKIVMIYIVSVVVGIVFGKLFKLPNTWLIVVILPCLLFAPTLVRNSYKNKHEFKRFLDVNVYIEQMLYAFKNSQKILMALQDVSELFQDGPMKEVIDQAIAVIQSPQGFDGKNVEEEALKVIEARYPNKYIKQLHRFMLKVENIGGDFDSSIQLLLSNRTMWENRTYKLQDVRKSKKTEVLISCISAVALCIMMLYILPSDVDISKMALVRLGNVITIIASFGIYIKADSKLATDLVNPKKERSDKEVLKDYEKFIHYDAKKERKKSIIWSIAPAIFLIFGIIVKNKICIGVAAVFLIIMLCQHSLGHSMLEKRLKREINEAFPQWLMELALLLQGDTVQVSILKTVDNALPVMKPELRKFKEALDAAPESSEPFLNFFYDFHIPEITTSMQMLYSLSAGTGGDADEQITNIVNRNNIILDRAEEQANQNSLASLNLLFLMPVVVGGAVLMLDMTMFLIQFMSVMSI